MPESYSAVLDARLVFEEVGDPTIDPGAISSAVGNVEAQAGGRRWTNGTGLGKVGAAYKRIRTIGSGATDTYDLLAAGGLQTPLGRPIDLDELKALSLQVTSGDVSVIYQGDVILGRLSMGTDYLNPAACVELHATSTAGSAF